MRPVALVLALGLATLVGGPVPAAQGVAEEPKPETHAAPTSGGTFWVEWSPDPAPVPLDEMFEIRFRVFEGGDHGALVSGAVVTAEPWMPEHNHGANLVPTIESHDDGTSTGKGFLLHMEGRWELRVGVAAGGRMERAVFEIEVKP